MTNDILCTILPNPLNTDLRKGIPIPQVAKIHGWQSPMAVGLYEAKIIFEGN